MATVDSLPPELRQLIFTKVTHPAHLLSLSLVERSWTHDALSQLYSSITLDAKLSARREALIKCRGRHQYRTTSLTFSLTWHLDDDCWRRFLWDFDSSHLRRLVLAGDGCLPCRLLSYVSGIDSLAMDRSATLVGETDALSQLTLKSLRFSRMSFWSMRTEVVEALLLSATLSVRKLDLGGLSLFANSALETEFSQRLALSHPLLPSLEELIFPEMSWPDTTFPRPVYDLLPLATSLDHLTLVFDEAATFPSINHHLRACLKLIQTPLSHFTLDFKGSDPPPLDANFVEILEEFMKLPVLGGLKTLVIIADDMPNLHGVEGGEKLLEKFAKGGIRYEN